MYHQLINCHGMLQSRLEVWKSRELTWVGKCYIIKSIGISQIAYAMEMKTIPEHFISEINKIFDNFMWKNGKRTIKRDLCTLPRELGGLGLIDVSILSKVKKVMWVIRYLKAYNNTERADWVTISSKYMKCMDMTLGIHLGALQVYDSSELIQSMHIPDFYKACIMSFQEFCRNVGVRNMHDIVWFNDQWKFQGKPVFFEHWAKSGILSIDDIVKDGRIDENRVYQKLIHKAGFIFEMSKIKSTFPQEWKKQRHSCEKKIGNSINKILEMDFNICSKDTKSLHLLTSKDIYEAFLLSRKTEVASKEYWSKKFSEVNIAWGEWFSQNFINKNIPRKCSDFNWKLFHGQLNTELRMKKMKYSNGICKMCESSEENAEHLIYKCGKTDRLWKYISSIIMNCISLEFEITCFDKIAYMPLQVEHQEFINMLLTLGRWSIWKIRNIKHYEGKMLSDAESLSLMKYEIKTHMEIISSGNLASRQTKECVGRIITFIDM